MSRRESNPAAWRWLIVFGVAWNGLFGVADYILIHLQSPAYVAFKSYFLNLSTEELLSYYDAWPDYARAGWVMNAVGGVAGALLLAMKDRYAVWLFLVSLVGLAMLSHLFYYAPFPRVVGDPWAEFLDLLRNGIALISGVYSLVVIVAIRRSMPES